MGKDGQGAAKPTRRTLLAGMGAALMAPMVASPLGAGRAWARAGGTPVDLALVMAVDSSASISKVMLDFQLRGHAAAFRDKAVHQALAGGPKGKVAVQLALFSGPGTLTTLVPWTLLATPQDALALADRIDAAPGVAMGGNTALGDCIVQAVRQLDACPYSADRRTIDLVSNGFNNGGIDPRSARAHAQAAGVGVNGLVILDEYDWLEPYYRDNVVAGEDAFVITAANRHAFADAFLSKLVREVV
ncbi:DUF1194 domain-containing protein [Nitrospirillum sp. BR 11828]|uniref:DUF1194 domain-containing protein n=1 Tax=Nitrospirillum sp. BR 11828 TaxID=3104325 RepID=UPI002ACAC13B|nr:DUF1194 domain-containing protein [Nitrospirillum sp. BR 11828]MDZ5646300.1 DUF1194 domain-containing protein [Nitrospirillum sp. BR 11828]